ncbi:hypothetical protein NJC11_27720 [Pseudomonas aeruginosa]|uniref:hypothetical protein n=2 Tax=Pseudomonas aeruginosa TaxID=287 RepID=UPI00209AAF61|nr:hypothetical protein [Pseudomonas aeruginosa]MCO7655286.1 hypothetical protein [Pseudomonas aeruginosa]
MSSTQHQLIEQCAIRLRGIVEALDNIHDNTPHRWSTDLDDVHSSAESLLALINDQAPVRSEASFEEWLANELEGEDGQPVPAAVCDIALARRAFNHWPKLEQPAKVGGVRFSAGVSSRLVVEAAQRLNEFESTPEQEAERPEVVAYRTIGRHTKHQHPHYALNYYKQNAEDQAAHWRERGCEVSEDELMTVSQHERIVKAWIERWKAYIELSAKIAAQRDAAQAEVEALRAELQSQRERNTELIFKLGSATNGWGRCEKERDAAQARCAELKAELAMANDAAAKGDAARHQCAGMEMEIKELRGAAEHWEAESRALQKLLDAALAKLAELEKQEPVAAVSEETFSANGTSDIITRNLPIGTTLYAAPVAPAQHSVPQAWLDVQAERRRQITAEGWTPEHDDEHSHGQMARAAACYALAGSSAPNDGTAALLVSLAWPWDEQWWKPTTTRRDLVKACALGLAEIERLDRAAAPGKEVGHE